MLHGDRRGNLLTWMNSGEILFENIETVYNPPGVAVGSGSLA